MKLELIQQLFVKNSCKRYLENLMDGVLGTHREKCVVSALFFTW